jgi:YOP proteins translocation protein K (YscK)
VLERDALRAVVDRREVQALRTRLGDEGYEFVLNTAPALQIAATGPAIEPRDPQWEAKALQQGASLLAAIMHAHSRAIGARAQLKLPRALCVGAPIVLSAKERALLRDVLILSVVEEVLPQWEWLF